MVETVLAQVGQLEAQVEARRVRIGEIEAIIGFRDARIVELEDEVARTCRRGPAPSSRPARARRRSRIRPYSDAELVILASDAHVVVADTPLVLPIIALSDLALRTWVHLDGKPNGQLGRDRFDAFRKAAADPRTAPVEDKLGVLMIAYGADEADRRLQFICPYFSRQWSKSICVDAWAPLKQAMPRQFYLSDDRKFGTFSNHYTVGGEQKSDQLKAMRLKVGEASIVCDQKTSSTGTRFCTAAILIKGHLAAVWTVWDGSKETSSRQAEREGKAITSFVLNAIGPAEDFLALFSSTCELRRPDVSIGPHGDQCDRLPSVN